MLSPRFKFQTKKNSVLIKQENFNKYSTPSFQLFYERTFLSNLFVLTINSKKYYIPKKLLNSPLAENSILTLMFAKISGRKEPEKFEIEVDTLLEKQLSILIDVILNPNGPPTGEYENLFISLALLRTGLHVDDIINYIKPGNEFMFMSNVLNRIDVNVAEAMIVFDPFKLEVEKICKYLKKCTTRSEGLDLLREYYMMDNGTTESTETGLVLKVPRRQIKKSVSVDKLNQENEPYQEPKSDRTSNKEDGKPLNRSRKKVSNKPLRELPPLAVGNINLVKLKNYNVKKVIIIQKAVRTHIENSRYSINSLIKRKNTYNEIVMTEKNLLRNLEVMKEHFAVPLENEPQSVEVFGSLDQCIGSSKLILGTLEEAEKVYKFDSNLGIVINSTLQLISPLLEYSINYNNMCAIWKSIKNTAKGKEVVNQAAEKIAPETLEQLLIQPVQRAMRYPMLIELLLKSTSVFNPDYSHLQKAYSNFHQFCKILNERAKMKDRLIEKSIEHASPCMLEKGRFHLLTMSVEIKLEKKKNVTAEICNDIIYFFKKKDPSLLVKQIGIGADLNCILNGLQLTLTKFNDENVVILSFKKEEEAIEFEKLIQWSMKTHFYILDDPSSWMDQLEKEE